MNLTGETTMSHKIKSFNEYNVDSHISEGINLRTASAVVLASKSNSINKSIKNIKTDDADLNKKLDLISRQLLYNSILIAQLGIMKKK